MPYTKAQHGLIGAALGAKKSGKKPPAYVPQSMAKLSKGKLHEMASSPTRKKIGKGDWGSTEKKSAGGSCTVVLPKEMLKGDPLQDIEILNHRGERVEEEGEAKMSRTQKVMTVGA
jgi:hypothetical protein